MSLDNKGKCEMRRRALLEAIRSCGGVVAFSRRLKVNRSRASNWCNQPDINIPYEFVVLMEDATQVSIERLSPFTEVTNKIIRRSRAVDEPQCISISINEIFVNNSPYYKCPVPDRPIIIGIDRVLISGLAKLEAYKKMGMKKIQVTVLDLEALILEVRSMRNIHDHFLISEKIAIGFRLEVIHRNHHKIPYITGFSCQTSYNFAKQVYCQGIPELMALVDSKQISMDKAATIAKLTVFEQGEQLRKMGH